MAATTPDNPREDPLSPRVLMVAYAEGYFPMAESRHSRGVSFYTVDPRAVLELDRLRVSRSLRQRVASGVFEVRFDTAFGRVMRACAEPRPDHPETWINEPIIRAYTRLHQLGCAHSVEAWREGRLVGGLYGVTMGGAFFGESMFSRAEEGGTDASKVCLVHLVEHLRRRRYVLLDVQTNSDHMRRMGVIDIPRAEYMRRLAGALRVEGVSWGE